MGKIVMPKNSALLHEIEAVLAIYYEAADWVPNEEYKRKLKAMIGDDQYSSSYTKKAQITSYFGFTEWENLHNPQSRRRITPAGRQMYEALTAGNTKAVQEVLMKALETVTFGRNNCGCPDSNSDIEPPSLYIRGILDMGYLTYREFAYMLWKLEDLGANYTDTLEELDVLRRMGTMELGEEALKYVDCKPIMILLRWGFLAEDAADAVGGKHIIIAPEVLSRYKTRLRNLKIYNVDMDYVDPEKCSLSAEDDLTGDAAEDMSASCEMEGGHDGIDLDTANRLETGRNILLYGVPGSGKSWIIQHEYCRPGATMERVVFHPDYTYSDFVGQILPFVAENGQVSYRFTPGPFTCMLRDAYWNPDREYILVIEEINRGNAPAIFGEVFQLLDRRTDRNVGRSVRLREVETGADAEQEEDEFPVGTSEYGISNVDLAKEIYGEGRKNKKVRIPSNLSIIGTMNTSDQNVFTLDTAFQRRWEMRLVENDFEEVDPALADAEILDTTVTWRRFCTEINRIISDSSIRAVSSEDKRLGAYFVRPMDLQFDDRMGDLRNGEYDALRKKERFGVLEAAEADRLAQIRQARAQNRRFPEKVIKYLWDDAFHFNREDVFNTEEYASLEQVIREFMQEVGSARFRIFKEDVRNVFGIAQINE